MNSNSGPLTLNPLILLLTNEWELLVLNILRCRTDGILVLRRIQVKKIYVAENVAGPTLMAYFANQPQNSVLLILDLASKSSQLGALGS